MVALLSSPSLRRRSRAASAAQCPSPEPKARRLIAPSAPPEGTPARRRHSAGRHSRCHPRTRTSGPDRLHASRPG
ncbi:MAG: hypothetical protein MZV64_10300 [Ignavibacteriales bacterium]|nr:hypothetical protein [Ignavibacteriales bacterium]